MRTIDELEKLTHRVTPSIEQDLIGRLQVYTEDKDNWEVGTQFLT